MDVVYDTLVENVSRQVIDAVVEFEEVAGKGVIGVDAVIRQVLQKIGELSTAGVFAVASDRVVAKARADRMIVNRSALIEVSCLYGTFEVSSPYLVNKTTKAHCRPVRDELGIQHRMKTPALQRALTDFGIEDSFGVAAERFDEHYGWKLHRTALLRVVQECASEAEDFIAERLAATADVPRTWGVLLEMDGCEIRTAEMCAATSGELTPVRELPKRKRTFQWRDVRLAFVREIDGDEKTFVGGMSPFAEVVDQLHSAARQRGMKPGTLVAAVIDGGNGLREAIEARFGDILCVLDRPHLSGHLHEVAKAMELSDRRRFSWVTRTLQALYDGRVASVIAKLQAYAGPGEARVDTFLKHLWRFQDAVDYGLAHHFGIPQGSGEIESAHRYIPQRRLKIPGAAWHPDSINPILSLRIVRANGWWDDFWSARAQAAA